KPESGKPESGKPESGKPESGKPESGKPESGKPESGKPESGKPEAGKPEAGKPESGKPESGKPTAGDDADAREEPLHDGEVFDQALKYLREKRGGDAGKAGKLDDLQNSARKPEPKADGASKPTTPPSERFPGDNANTGKPGEGAVNATRTEPTTEKPTTDKPSTGQPPTDKPVSGQPTTDKPPRDPVAGKNGNSPQGKPDPSDFKNDEPQLPGSGKPPADPRDNPGKAFNPDAKPNTQPPVDPQQPRGGTTPPQNPGRTFAGAETPEGDAVNLDYARRATDLVLDYLKDQKDKPDRELLDRLGWTPDELARFVDRWEKMKQASRDENRDVKRDLDETLKSLGLRPAADQRRSVGATSDGQRGNRDAGARSEPPPKYRERFEAYRQGTTRPTPAKP
ncbi:MAG: hypothetical protein ACKOBW_18475, partial [Planctomycetota bacterium]